MQRGIASRRIRERLDEKVAPLLRCHASEEQQRALAVKLREALQEGFTLCAGIALRPGDAITDDGHVRAIVAETGARETALFLAGEQHRACVAQHVAFSDGPIERLLEVLERI